MPACALPSGFAAPYYFNFTHLWFRFRR